ncbi:hypothetical protein BC834DRAFT_862434 [Gloeopeniophorella convolvens]|nr:hypothetical protein BC834DRAFT_862434 [Gloeopeniophorella convolvens]
MQPPSPDIVSIEDLGLHTSSGVDILGHRSLQPHKLSIHFHLHPTSLLLAAATDDARFSIRYWDLEDEVLGRIRAGVPWVSGRALARAVTGVAFAHAGDAVQEVRVVLESPNGHRRATGGMGWELTTPHGAQSQDVLAFVRGLELGVLMGGMEPERQGKQRVVMDIWFREKPEHAEEVDYAALVDRVIEETESSAHRTLERVVHEAARVACAASSAHCKEVIIRARRPSAMAFADALVVQLQRPCST